MIRDHLGIEAPVLGNIPYVERIERSVNERRPFMLWAGLEPSAQNFRAMAHRLVEIFQAIDSHDHKRKSLPTPTTGRYDRIEPRFPVRRVPASLATQGLILSGHVRDLAHGGILVELSSPAPPDRADGVLTVGPLSDGRQLSVGVTERHRDRSATRVGFAFVDLAPHLENELERLVAEATAATAVRQTPYSNHAKPPAAKG